MTKKPKAPPAYITHAAKYNCTCGWSSVPVWGPGTTGQAAAQLAAHKRDHIEGRIKPEDWRQFGKS